MQFSQYAIAALAAMSMIGAVAGAGADDTTASPHHASVILPNDAAATATATTTTSSSSTRMTAGDGDPATATATAPRKLAKIQLSLSQIEASNTTN